MDPDAVLERTRNAMRRVDDAVSTYHKFYVYEADPAGDLANAAEELVAAFRDLDAWMSRGGFAPMAWGGIRAVDSAPAEARCCACDHREALHVRSSDDLGSTYDCALCSCKIDI